MTGRQGLNNKKSVAGLTGLTVLLAIFMLYNQPDKVPPPDPSKTLECQFEVHPMGVNKLDCPTATNQIVSVLHAKDMLAPRSDRPTSIKLVTGEKSITAGTGLYMAAAIVETENGNTVADGTTVIFSRDGKVMGTSKTLGGLATILDGEIVKSGQYNIVARAKGISSLSNFIRVVAAEPVRIAINESASKLDVGKFTKLSTILLKDRFGNVIPDGTLLQYRGEDTNGQSFIVNSVSVNGVSSAVLSGRELIDKVSVEPRLSEISGQGVKLDIRPSIFLSAINVNALVRGGIVDLTLGPLRTVDGETVHDGQMLSVEFDSGRKVHTQVSEGFAQFQFTHPSPGSPARMVIRSGAQSWHLELDSASHGNADWTIQESGAV